MLVMSCCTSHQLILENAEAPQEIDGVEQYAFRLACYGAVLHADLHFRYANLVVFVQSQRNTTIKLTLNTQTENGGLAV